MLSKKYRLKKKKDFERVVKKGRPLQGRFLVLKFIKNKQGESRIGFIVSKRVSKKAVLRNKAKRRLRAAVRELILHLKEGYDIIIFSRASIIDAQFQEIKQDIEQAFKRAGLLKL